MKPSKNVFSYHAALLNQSYIVFVHRFEEKSTKRPLHRPRRWRKSTTMELELHLDGIIQELAARCMPEANDAIAPGCYLRPLSRAVAVLEGLVLQCPELWKPLAHHRVQWPILFTWSPRISRLQRENLRLLELGHEAFLALHLNTRTSTEDAATRYAISILQTLKENQVIASSLCALACPQWAKDAQKLPRFSERTWRSWWLLGKQAFLEAIPHPEEIEVLAKVAHTKQTAAEKRALILERIGRAVRSLAPASTPSPKPS